MTQPSPAQRAARAKETEAEKTPPSGKEAAASPASWEASAVFSDRMDQADSLIKHRKFLDAQSILLKLEPEHRDNPEIYVRLGACDMGTEHYQAAVGHYQAALQSIEREAERPVYGPSVGSEEKAL